MITYLIIGCIFIFFYTLFNGEEYIKNYVKTELLPKMEDSIQKTAIERALADTSGNIFFKFRVQDTKFVFYHQLRVVAIPDVF